MNRKYIDDLGIKYEKTPQGWNPQEDIYKFKVKQIKGIILS